MSVTTGFACGIFTLACGEIKYWKIIYAMYKKHFIYGAKYIIINTKEHRAKDVEEMNGHFLMFNKMLETLEQPLSQIQIYKR